MADRKSKANGSNSTVPRKKMKPVVGDNGEEGTEMPVPSSDENDETNAAEMFKTMMSVAHCLGSREEHGWHWVRQPQRWAARAVRLATDTL